MLALLVPAVGLLVLFALWFFYIQMRPLQVTSIILSEPPAFFERHASLEPWKPASTQGGEFAEPGGQIRQGCLKVPFYIFSFTQVRQAEDEPPRILSTTISANADMGQIALASVSGFLVTFFFSILWYRLIAHGHTFRIHPPLVEGPAPMH